MGFCPKEAHCASETALSLGARPQSDVPAAASNKQLSCACAQEKAPPRSLSLSGGGAARALATCARRAALVRVGSCPMGAHCANKTALFVGARLRSDVPAATSNKQVSCVCAQETKRHRARSLCREEAQHARWRSARAAPRWLDSVPSLWKPTVPARQPSFSVHGRDPMCQPRPPTSCFLAHVGKIKRHRARSFSREEAQHARLRHARVVLRWLESVLALWKPTVPARRLSSSVHGRALGALRADIGIEFEVTPPYIHWLNGHRGTWHLTTTFWFRYWRSISAATRARKRLSALSRHKSSLVCTHRQIRIGLDHRRSGFCSKKSPTLNFLLRRGSQIGCP